MRKVAFLVGNDTFPNDPSIPPLRFPRNDAKELGEILADQETCGFETKLYLNEPSYKILEDLDHISGQLTTDDTLLFYYSGHGKLRGNELCLVSTNTRSDRLKATSIKAQEVLGYLRESFARRRVLILDCCHSGVVTNDFKGEDLQSTLDALSHSFGTYILSASTAIQLAEEREQDGHGIFTKALIDCLREGGKESITISDLYNYAFARLISESESQTPLLTVHQQEGAVIEIGNFRAKHERLRREQEEQLISTARIKLNALVASGALTELRFKTAMRLLEAHETALIPHERERRDRLKRYLKGELDFFDVEPQIDDRPVRPRINYEDGSRPQSSYRGPPSANLPGFPPPYWPTFDPIVGVKSVEDKIEQAFKVDAYRLTGICLFNVMLQAVNYFIPIFQLGIFIFTLFIAVFTNHHLIEGEKRYKLLLMIIPFIFLILSAYLIMYPVSYWTRPT
jgi:hypothetical protein